MSIQNKYIEQCNAEEVLNAIMDMCVFKPATFFSPELNKAKKELVSAINSHGGNSNTDETLLELAQDVKDIQLPDFDRRGVVYEDGYEPSNIFDVIVTRNAIKKIESYRNIIINNDRAFALLDNMETVELNNLQNLDYKYVFEGCTSLKNVKLGASGLAYIGAFKDCSNLENVDLRNINTIDCHSGLQNEFFISSSKIKSLNFDSLEYSRMKLLGLGDSDIEYLCFPRLSKIERNIYLQSNGCFISSKKLKTVEFPVLLYNGENDNYNVFIESISLERVYFGVDVEFRYNNTSRMRFNCDNLIDIEIKSISRETWLDWTPSSVITDPDKVRILNSNIRNHIAANCVDATGKTALIMKFNAKVFNVLEDETIAAFTNKNWTVASA